MTRVSSPRRIGKRWGAQPSSTSARARPATGPDARKRTVGGCALGLARGNGRRLALLERGGEQIARREAAIGAPLLGDVQNLLLGGPVIKLIGVLDRLARREIAGQDDVLSPERDQQSTLRRPWADPRDRGEFGDDLV